MIRLILEAFCAFAIVFSPFWLGPILWALQGVGQ